MTVRSYLVLLVLAAIVPLLVFTVVIVERDLQNDRELLTLGMENTVRALSLAVDREAQTSLAVLETLAASPSLRTRDMKSFHALCVAAVAGRRDAWIVLFDRSGQQLVNSSRPFGSRLPNPFAATGAPASDPRYPTLPLGGAAPVREALETARPVVSDLFVALDSRRPTIGVGLPLIRNGTAAYVLEMSVDRDALLRLLLEQHPPDDGVVALLDRKGRIIARTADSARVVGLSLVPELAAQIARSNDGSGVGPTREGVLSYHAFTRSKVTGWTTSLAVPEVVVSGPLRRLTALVVGGAATVVLVSLGLAFLVGKRISAPLTSLAGAAGAMARGERVELHVPHVREIADLHAALVTAAAGVREGAADRDANRAKDEFLATLSHELRTPINAVYGWARMLRTGQLKDDARDRALDTIMRNTHAQIQLIDDLLDVSRIVSGKMRLDVRAVDLKAVVEAALDAVRPATDAKEIRLQSVLDPRAGPITGDPDRLQQVVWNLLANAVKFTPKHGRVQVHLQRVNSHVEIVVSDTGEGITAELLPFVFDRFRQGESSATRARGGLGLGLALVRHLVEAHGGSVTAQSPGEGAGATFVVRLPLALAKLDDGGDARVHPTAAVAIPGHIGPGLLGVRVLVVDDQIDALDVARAILTAAEAEVRTCQSAAESLAVLRAWRPDVLIADIEMPGEDGLSLIARVRALDATEGGKTPAIALTAYGRVEDRLRTLAAGFNMHVPKPVDAAELTAIVASLAGREVPREG